jgi:hypothetical protein
MGQGLLSIIGTKRKRRKKRAGKVEKAAGMLPSLRLHSRKKKKIA